MRDIVSIADIGEAYAAQIAESLLKSEVIGKRLTGMFHIAQRIDYRNRSVLGHSGDRFLREGAQHDHVHPALKIVRDVAELFACIEPPLRLVYENRGAAQARHSRFKSEARAQRRLLEKHHHLFSRKRSLKHRRTRL